MEEFEAIDTEFAVFRRHLDINAAMIRSQDANPFVGKVLGESAYGHDVLLNRRVPLSVPNPLAASWFFPNTVTVWEEDSYVLGNVNASERKRISEELARTRDSVDERHDTAWHRRRLALRRQGRV